MDKKLEIPTVSWRSLESAIKAMAKAESSLVLLTDAVFLVAMGLAEEIPSTSSTTRVHPALPVLPTGKFDIWSLALIGIDIWASAATQPKRFRLTSQGRLAYLSIFVYKDRDTTDEIMSERLLCDPVIDFVVRSFRGRGWMEFQSMQNLLALHLEDEVYSSDISRMLELLDRYRLIEYRPLNYPRTFRVSIATSSGSASDPYLLSPDTPFTNKQKLARVLSTLEGTVYWLDKHFKKDVFPLIVDTADGRRTQTLTIISGPEHAKGLAIQLYQDARTELKFKGVALEWRVVPETHPDYKQWHDRWLVGDNLAYNVPPVGAIWAGHVSEIVPTTNRPPISTFIRASTPIP